MSEGAVLFVNNEGSTGTEVLGPGGARVGGILIGESTASVGKELSFVKKALLISGDPFVVYVESLWIRTGQDVVYQSKAEGRALQRADPSCATREPFL